MRLSRPVCRLQFSEGWTPDASGRPPSLGHWAGRAARDERLRWTCPDDFGSARASPRFGVPNPPGEPHQQPPQFKLHAQGVPLARGRSFIPLEGGGSQSTGERPLIGVPTPATGVPAFGVRGGPAPAAAPTAHVSAFFHLTSALRVLDDYEYQLLIVRSLIVIRAQFLWSVIHPLPTRGLVARQNREDVLKQFGETLRSYRLEAGLSQEKLAAKAGLDRTYVGGAERGERNVALVNIVRLAEALGLRPSQLLEPSQAYRCKLHPTYISQLERGVKSPTVRVLVLVAGAVGIKASELLREAEHDQN
jgi:transcriptional regulator with XRE-family HTH domain